MFCCVCLVKYMDGQIEAKCPVCTDPIVRDEWRAVSTLSGFQEYLTPVQQQRGDQGEVTLPRQVYVEAAVAVGQVVTAELLVYHAAPSCRVEYPTSIDFSRAADTADVRPVTAVDSHCRTPGTGSVFSYFLPSSWNYLLHHVALELELMELFLVECRSCSSAAGAAGEGLYGHSNADPCWIPSINESVYLLREYQQRCQRELAAANCSVSLLGSSSGDSGNAHSGSATSSVCVPVGSALLGNMQLTKPFDFGGSRYTNNSHGNRHGNGHGDTQKTSARDELTLYYQLPATQEFWCFLHPLTASLVCHGGMNTRTNAESTVALPFTITGPVLQVELVVVSHASRQRYPFLRVVPLFCTVSIVELDIYGGLRSDTLNYYKSAIQQRSRGREQVSWREQRERLQQEDERMAHAVYVEEVKETHRRREDSRNSMVRELLNGPVVGRAEAGVDTLEGTGGATAASASPLYSFANIAQMGGNFPMLGQVGPPTDSGGSISNRGGGGEGGVGTSVDVGVGGGAWQVLTSPSIRSAGSSHDPDAPGSPSTSSPTSRGRGKGKGSRDKIFLSNSR